MISRNFFQEDYLRTAYDIKHLERLAKISSKPDLNYIGKNLAFSLMPEGVYIAIRTNYEKAKKEVIEAFEALSKFEDKAVELLEAFDSIPPKEGDVTNPEALNCYFDEKLGILGPLFLSEEERGAIIKEGREKLAQQLVSYFENFNEKKWIDLQKKFFLKIC